MDKKNTLLYLDRTLVKEAKKSNLNLSKITEDAIKHYLFISQSTAGRASLNYGHYLATLKEEKRCFFLAHPLEEMELSCIGIIDGLKTQFSKFNVFTGNFGTGKTTVVRSIVYMLGFPEVKVEQLLKSQEPKGEIRLNVHSEEPLILKLARDKDGEITKQEKIGCILLDEPGEEFDDENYKKFIYYLRGLDSQIIMTTSRSNWGFSPEDKIVDMNIFRK